MAEYRTNQIAQSANVTVNTVRNWAKEFAQFLSPGATVTTGHRCFSDRDRAVLLYIAQLRNENLQSADITQRLTETSFPEIDDSERQGTTAIEASTDPLEAPKSDLVPYVSLDTIHALEKRIEARFDAMERRRWDGVVLFAFGFCAASLMFLLLILLANLYAK